MRLRGIERPKAATNPRAVVAGVVGAFVVLFLASFAVSSILHRRPAVVTRAPAVQTAAPAAAAPVAAPASIPVAPAAPAAAAATPVAAAPAPATSSPDAMDQWKLQVVGLLNRSLRIPAGVACESGVVRLAFRIGRQGQLVASAISGPSGTKAFDDEALAMLARIQNFPPPPNSSTEIITLEVPIRFTASNTGCPQN